MRPEPEALAKIPLFASLSADELRAIATLAEERDEPPGATLMGEGAPGYSLFVLEEGAATVSSGGDEIGKLEAGDFFGEIALLTRGERTATVTALTPVRVLVMHGSDFRVFEREWPDASALLKETMAERLEHFRPRG
jgi:voltage-gated potassium channel